MDTHASSKENCDATPGRLSVVVDYGRCEGDAVCGKVCPYDVFDVRRLTSEEWRSRAWRGKLRLLMFGGKQAFASRVADCHACGVCVKACPEHALKLSPISY